MSKIPSKKVGCRLTMEGIPSHGLHPKQIEAFGAMPLPTYPLCCPPYTVPSIDQTHCVPVTLGFPFTVSPNVLILAKVGSLSAMTCSPFPMHQPQINSITLTGVRHASSPRLQYSVWAN